MIKLETLDNKFQFVDITKTEPDPNVVPSKIINRLYPMNYWNSHGWGWGQGSFHMHEMTIPISIGIIKCCSLSFYKTTMFRLAEK